MATTKTSFGFAAPHQPEGLPDNAVVLTGEALVVLDGPAEIEMLVNKTGLRYGQPWPRLGERITVPPEEAIRLIRANSAKLAEPEPEPERAVVPEEPVEKAVRPRRR